VPAEAPVIREIPVPVGGKTVTVILSGTTVRAMLADTDELRIRGLSGRPSLSEDEGMLFVFPNPGTYGFWMKDMQFPIDIIWISESGHVVGVTPMVLPDTFPKTFFPPQPVVSVLEVPAGFSTRFGVVVGQSISFEK